MNNLVFFFWGGDISNTRLQLLRDCIYSTKHFNPEREIVLVSNSLNENMFSEQYGIKIMRWDESLFEGSPINPDLVRKYYLNAWYRDQSDIVRMGLLYRYGGSYIDTDDICLRKMSDASNLVCRSYDPHTCHYNKLSPEDCIDGTYREIRGYDNINMFPRNDCWQNFEPRSEFLTALLSDEKIQKSTKPIGICDDFSWQSLTLKYLKIFLPQGKCSYGLTLLYLPEGHVSCCSLWDMGIYGGEMIDRWKALPGVVEQEWGKYKCKRDVAMKFFYQILEDYPFVSHLWLHDKDANKEWLTDIDLNGEYAVSTWIINEIRRQVYGG
jgi:hypothetical protein